MVIDNHILLVGQRNIQRRSNIEVKQVGIGIPDLLLIHHVRQILNSSKEFIGALNAGQGGVCGTMLSMGVNQQWGEAKAN